MPPPTAIAIVTIAVVALLVLAVMAVITVVALSCDRQTIPNPIPAPGSISLIVVPRLTLIVLRVTRRGWGEDEGTEDEDQQDQTAHEWVRVLIHGEAPSVGSPSGYVLVGTGYGRLAFVLTR